jgi:signal transduction histidine kinase
MTLTTGASPGAVLVVDDNDLDRANAVGILQKEGFSVVAVSSGFEALEKLPDGNFDAVVTDIVMPGMSGFEVIRAVRDASPDVVCIAMTSHGALGSALDAINMGAYSYLTKPVDPLALRHALTRGLERRRLIQDLRERNKSLESLNRELDSKVQQATQELRDLNQRVLNEMAGLKELDQLKSAFLGNVSHDLKSPLTTILGYIGYMREYGGLPEEMRKCVESTQAAAMHMKYLINQLVEAGSLSAGKVELERKDVPVAPLLEEAAALMRPQTDASGTTLAVELDGAAGMTVRTDRGRLLQVLSNLLGNACKFTPKGGRITLKAWRETGGTRFAVEDTGIGIAPEHQARVFEKFYQVDPALNRIYKGMGLGLRIAKEIVELHGGKIGLESKVGSGSRFQFSIPDA